MFYNCRENLFYNQDTGEEAGLRLTSSEPGEGWPAAAVSPETEQGPRECQYHTWLELYLNTSKGLIFTAEPSRRNVSIFQLHHRQVRSELIKIFKTKSDTSKC